jgi:hypothetical protein
MATETIRKVRVLVGFLIITGREVSDAGTIMEDMRMLSQLSPRLLRASERDVQAVRLRIAGKTLEEIALALGYRSKGSAWKAVARAKTARLVELARLVRRPERVEVERDLAAVERRVKALQSGKGNRSR